MRGHLVMHDGRLYTLRLVCGEDYPDRPPTVRFVSKLALGCVNPSTGAVDAKHLRMLGSWSREYTIESILVELRREMTSPANRKLPQPPEGSNF